MTVWSRTPATRGTHPQDTPSLPIAVAGFVRIRSILSIGQLGLWPVDGLPEPQKHTRRGAFATPARESPCTADPPPSRSTSQGGTNPCFTRSTRHSIPRGHPGRRGRALGVGESEREESPQDHALAAVVRTYHHAAPPAHSGTCRPNKRVEGFLSPQNQLDWKLARHWHRCKGNARIFSVFPGPNLPRAALSELAQLDDPSAVWSRAGTRRPDSVGRSHSLRVDS